MPVALDNRSGAGIALAVLAAACSAAHADAYTELAALRFTPYPISSERPVDAAAPAPANQASIAADSGTEDEPSARQVEAIVRRVESLAAEQARNGPRSEDLVDDLTALAALYQQVGDHDAALAALERGLQLRRVHDGLYSLEEVDIVEQMIDSRVARGEYGESAALEQRLLELTGRNASDPRVAHVLSAAGDRQMETFERLLEEGPADVVIEMSMLAGNTGGFDARRRGFTALTALRAARSRYGAAIGAAWRNASHDEAGRLELREKLVDTYYLELHEEGVDAGLSPHGVSPMGMGGPPRRSPAGLYGAGVRVLEARLRERATLGQPPAAVAAAFMELGDWHLLFSRNSTALGTYEAAHAFLVGTGGADDAAIARLLAVEPPRALPLLAPSPERQAYRGHFDVAFEITKYGQGKHVEVLGRSPGASDDVEKRLKRHIYASRFRPRLVDGHAVGTDRVAVRYYFDY